MFCCWGPSELSAAHVTLDRSAAAERALVVAALLVTAAVGVDVVSLQAATAITPNSVLAATDAAGVLIAATIVPADSTVPAEVGRIGLGKLPRLVRGFERMEVTSAVLSLLSPLTSSCQVAVVSLPNAMLRNLVTSAVETLPLRRMEPANS